MCLPCMSALPHYTSRCYRCTTTVDAYRTCEACRKVSPLTHVWAPTRYTHDAKTLVQFLKFERASAAAITIGDAIAQMVPPDSIQVVTHAPTASLRVRQRGYDQAQLIARQVARRLAVPYAPLLVRQGSQRQLGQSRQVRERQMATAFRTRRAYAIRQADVLLVDDVITTGSTLEAAAAVLCQAGARSVAAAVFAVA